MFRLLSKQAFKPMGVHHYRLQVHHPRSAISTAPRRNTDNDSHHNDGHCHDNDSHHNDGHCHDNNSGGTGWKSNSASFVTWKDFSHLDKDVANVKLKLDHLESGQKEMKAEIKHLGNKMDKKFDHVDRKFDKMDAEIKHLGNKMDRKSDKTDVKIDRVLFMIITGLVGFVLKGGFDYYDNHKK